MALPPSAPAAPPTPTDPAQAELHALQQALAALVEPVARLAVARGLALAPVEALLRAAFVQAASAAHPGLPEHRKVSRIATTTGLNRREVARLVALQQPREGDAHPSARSTPASQAFALWRTDPAWRGPDGQPKRLARLGAADSFEALAHRITRDVHPRSLLDELVRLGLVHWDADADTVALATDRFVAQGDRVRQLGLLGDNVGDHLRAAVDNVLGSASGQGPAHLEQAVFAWGLSNDSLAALQPAIRAQWKALVDTLVPQLRERVAADAAADAATAAAADAAADAAHATAPAPAAGRIRIGLYAYQEGTPAASAAPSVPAVRRRAPRTQP